MVKHINSQIEKPQGIPKRINTTKKHTKALTQTDKIKTKNKILKAVTEKNKLKCKGTTERKLTYQNQQTLEDSGTAALKCWNKKQNQPKLLDPVKIPLKN